jgi:hypothetical protein
MALLLRLTTLLGVISGLLVFASIALGQMTDATIVTGNQEIEGQTYTMYIEDTAQHLRIALAGTRCFETLPAWVYPKTDAVAPPTGINATFFVKVVQNIMEVLTRCRP